MNHDVLGVIGGMGPEASAYFYNQIVRHTCADSDQSHLDMVILSCASMPDRTGAILSGDHEQLLATMRSCLKKLEACGATQIAIPCNTSHYFYNDIQRMSSIPIIHMPRETIRTACEEHGAQRIGILGTDGTVTSGVYAWECERFGAECIVPSPEAQRDVMSLIYDDIKAGREPDRQKFDRAASQLLERGCDTLILACTELSILKECIAMPERTIDALEVLVRASIERCGGTWRAKSRNKIWQLHSRQPLPRID